MMDLGPGIFRPTTRVLFCNSKLGRNTAQTTGIGVKAILFCFFAGSIMSASCRRTIQGPHDTVKAYVLAIKHDDIDRAYSLLSGSLKQQSSRGQFALNVKQAGKKNRQALELLLQNPDRIEITAKVDLGYGEILVLRKEREGWRIVSDPFSFYEQKTPREALRSFIRALERKRYEVIIRFAPRKWRRRMDIEDLKDLYEGENAKKTKILISKLKKSQDNHIEISGDKAVMLYGDNQQVSFVREEGVWKILEFD